MTRNKKIALGVAAVALVAGIYTKQAFVVKPLLAAAGFIGGLPLYPVLAVLATAGAAYYFRAAIKRGFNAVASKLGFGVTVPANTVGANGEVAALGQMPSVQFSAASASASASGADHDAAPVVASVLAFN